MSLSEEGVSPEIDERFSRFLSIVTRVLAMSSIVPFSAVAQSGSMPEGNGFRMGAGNADSVRVESVESSNPEASEWQ